MDQLILVVNSLQPSNTVLTLKPPVIMDYPCCDVICPVKNVKRTCVESNNMPRDKVYSIFHTTIAFKLSAWGYLLSFS